MGLKIGDVCEFKNSFWLITDILGEQAILSQGVGFFLPSKRPIKGGFIRKTKTTRTTKGYTYHKFEYRFEEKTGELTILENPFFDQDLIELKLVVLERILKTEVIKKPNLLKVRLIFFN